MNNKDFNRQVSHWVYCAEKVDKKNEDEMACWDYANGEFIMELIHRYEHVSKLVELNEHMKAFINNQVEMDPEIQAIIYSNMEKLYVE